MLNVLALAGIERFCNSVLSPDVFESPLFFLLLGKSIQFDIATPPLSVVVVFADDHVSFEPVASQIFEPKGGITPKMPDCTAQVLTLKDLWELQQDPTPHALQGDEQVWQDFSQLLMFVVEPKLRQFSTHHWNHWLEPALLEVYQVGAKLNTLRQILKPTPTLEAQIAQKQAELDALYAKLAQQKT